MKNKKKQPLRKLAYFLVPALLLAIIFTSLTPIMVLAVPSYNITNDIINVTMGAGQSYTSLITITDQSADESMDLQLEVAGLGQGLDGSSVALTTSQDVSPYSARNFCSIDNDSLNIEPGSSGAVNATVSVPSGTQAGEYYAAVYMYTQPSSDDKVGVRLAILVPVIVTIPGFTPINSAQMSGPTVPPVTSGQTIEVDTALLNSGNCRISSASDTVTLYSSSGTQLAQSVLQLTSPSILPTFSRQFAAHFTGRAAGSYSVKSFITLGDGTQLPVNSASFNVLQPSTTTTNTLPAPVINSFTPASGGKGTQVTITGTGFTGASEVGFGGVAADSFNVDSDTQITAILDSGATGNVTVTGPGGIATSTSIFTFTGSTNQTTITSTTTGTISDVVISAPVTLTFTNISVGGNTTTSTSIVNVPPGLDPASIMTFHFDAGQNPYADATSKDGVIVSLTGVSGSGDIIISKYLSEPQTAEAFSDSLISGGTGKQPVRFVDVMVRGYNTGTAHITFQNSDSEIANFTASSLFLAYYDGKWNISRNVSNSAAGNTTSGDIPVYALNGTIVSLGGDTIDTGTVGFPANNNDSTAGISGPLIAIIIGSAVVIGVVLAVVMIIQKRNQK